MDTTQLVSGRMRLSIVRHLVELHGGTVSAHSVTNPPSTRTTPARRSSGSRLTRMRVGMTASLTCDEKPSGRRVRRANHPSTPECATCFRASAMRRSVLRTCHSGRRQQRRRSRPGRPQGLRAAGCRQRQGQRRPLRTDGNDDREQSAVTRKILCRGRSRRAMPRLPARDSAGRRHLTGSLVIIRQATAQPTGTDFKPRVNRTSGHFSTVATTACSGNAAGAEVDESTVKPTRRLFSRRAFLGTAAAAGLGGVSLASSSCWPARFVRGRIAEVGREVPLAPHTPTPGGWPDNAITLGWLGHATVLINFYGVRVLTDPACFPGLA